MRMNVIWSIIGILMVFCLISCSGDDDPKIYAVTIGNLENGSITVNPTSGTAGTEIILTVNPDNLYKLKTGTLKYGATTINETILKFNLPESNVTVSAEFESFFIGKWNLIIPKYDINNIFTFYDELFILQEMDNDINIYSQMGTWKNEISNILTFKYTHYAPNGGINDFIEGKESEFVIEQGEFEILSDKSFRMYNIKNLTYNYIIGEYFFTFIE